jgi:hypothetical protein
MFDWFIMKYGKTTTTDRKENWQQMAADWHPSNGFDPLATILRERGTLHDGQSQHH